jgi:hypothetical protein
VRIAKVESGKEHAARASNPSNFGFRISDLSFGGGLGVLGALDADGLARALAGAGVGAGALAADGQAAAVPDAAVAIDGLEALEILLQLPAQVTLDDVLVLLDDLDDAVELLVGQLLGPDVGADLGLLEHELGAGRADAVDVRQRGFDALFAGDVDTEETGHGSR